MAGTTFKYKDQIRSIGGCPATDCVEGERDSYRWVHAEPITEDFLPQALEDPVRRRPIDETDLERRCLSWGLSMYDTIEAAIVRFKQVISRIRGAKQPDFRTQKGDSVAFIQLKPSHGRTSPSNKEQHFTLFEYEDVDLRNDIVKIINIFD
ncbi:MAG TPA: hypothetical protein VL978_07625, partial [Puia sp.]|nr:hypothetical protein [Puia sp.]